MLLIYNLRKELNMPKRRIFISFDHDDTEKVNGFLGLRNIIDNLDFFNHKLDHRINSNDENYVRKVIRVEYINPSSVTVVLIGNRTANSRWVNWEIEESKRQGKGILGIRLKDTFGTIPTGIPQDHVGDWKPDKFVGWIEWAFEHKE